MFRRETEFVHWLRTQPRSKARGLILGIGDDAAIVRLSPRYQLILKADMSIEDVHFARRLHPPRSVGHRALARSLSDVAAVGGTPRFALVSLALSRETSRVWIEELYAGMLALGKQFGVVLVGGDTAVLRGGTVVDVTVAGEVRRGKALLRSGAEPGDRIFVSGRLGLSALGLRFLQSSPGLRLLRRSTPPVRPKLSWDVRPIDIREEAIRAHLFPEPRFALGHFLSETHLASALIDVSDGLSTDLDHLCKASGVGARVSANRIPAPKLPDSWSQVRRSTEPIPRPIPDRSRMELALHGGEDYELLFTVPPRKAAKIPPRYRGVPLQCIGEICRSKELLLIRPDGKETVLRPSGYDHFREQ